MNRLMQRGAAAALVAVTGIALVGCGGDGSAERRWNLGASVGAGGIAFVDGALWVGVSDQQVSPERGSIALVRVDPSDGSVDLRLDDYGLEVVGEVDGALWVGDGGSALAGLDPTSGEVGRHTGVLDLTDEPRSLVLAGNRLFAIGFSGAVQEFDRGTGELAGDVPDPQGDGGEAWDTYSRALAGDSSRLFLETDVEGTRSLAAFDAESLDLAWSYPLPTSLGPAGLDVRDGILWALFSSSDAATAQQVVRFDAATGVVLSSADLPDATALIDGDNVALRFSPDGTPWVLVAGDSAVLRLDPATGAVAATFTFSSRPTAFAASNEAVFTVANGSGDVTRVDRDDFVAVEPSEG